MLRIIFILIFFSSSIIVHAQIPPFAIANFGGLNLSIATDTCFSGSAITSLSPNQRLVSSATLSSNCGIWQEVSIPSPTQHINTSGYICGTFSALCDIGIDTITDFIEVFNTDTNGLFVRPAPVAGHVTISGLNAKIWDGQRFALTGNIQTVGGGTWREIYLTDNCSQLTGWVSDTFLIVFTGIAANQNVNSIPFTLHPNPATNIVQLTFNNPTNKDYLVHLIDSKGKALNSYLNSNVIDISDLVPGVYFMQVEQNGIRSSRRFVKLL